MKTKRSEPAAARDLYTSPLFLGAKTAVDGSCDRWFVLSAKHGLVHPDTRVEPYEETLKGAPRNHKRHWSEQVVEDLRDTLGSLQHAYEIHAGAEYYDWGLRAGLERAGGQVVLPLEGLSMGQRLSYYSTRSRPAAVAPAPPASGRPVEAHRDDDAAGRSAAKAPVGKYRPLFDHLSAIGDDYWEASFAEVERVLGFSLPASARRYQAWWGNARDGSHSHARAWLAAGFETAHLRLNAARVTFERVRR